jgi:membrane protease YdiL (CAAX protease family)
VTQAEPGGLPYHRIHRAFPRPGDVWRSILGVVTLAFGVVALAPLVVLSAFSIWYVVTGADVEASIERLVDTDNVTPAGLAYVFLVLASAIPVTWAISRLLHGLPPRWLASVAPRIRWRWFVTCLGLAVLALAATLVVSGLLPDQGGSEMSGELNDFTSTTREFALVVLLLTPLQAAGEEYAFRGYLTQAFGGMVNQVWVAVAVPALLFALAHGLGQSWPIFFDRFAFGLVAGSLVILTGGLEAGIAMHVLNNWLAFGLALAYGDMSSTLNPTGGTWWSIPVTLTQSLVYLGLAVVVSRRTGLQTTTRPGVLEASRGRV